jgi:transposase
MDERDKKIAELEEIIVALRAEVVALISENKELHRRLGMNSGNSSKPPSSDGLRKKPAPQRLREGSGKKSGGQVGHKGATLEFSATPDIIVHHLPETCVCGTDLSQIMSESVPEKRQVFDIPHPKIEITEHLLHRKICPHCRAVNKAAAPASAPAPVNYGENVRSYAVYLQHGQLLPEDRLAQLFDDVFGLKIAPRTLVSYGEHMAETLAPWQDNLQTALNHAPVRHADETGFRIGGKTAWLHSLSTTQATLYRPGPKRGAIPSGLAGGVLVHDHWRPYFALEGVQHALCGAHLLREIKALMQENEPWAAPMYRHLQRLSRLVKRPLSDHTKARFFRVYDATLQRGLAYHEALPEFCKITPKRGKKPKRPGHNLLIRLRDYNMDVLRCLENPAVPFTNNLAERDIRMMKVKQKISGGFRCLKGAQTFATIRSLLSTAAKQNLNLLQTIKNSFSGQPPPIRV